MALPSNLKRKPGLFGSMAAQQPAMAAEPMQMAAPRKSGFFGEGGAGRAIAGNIGDALLQFSGMQPIYQPAMADQRAMQFRAQQDAQRQQQDRANFIFEQDYKRANPAPVAPHYWETNDGSLGMIGPDGQPRVVYQDPDEKIQWLNVNNGDGTTTLVPYNSKGPLGQQPQQGAPAAPKGKLTPYNGGQSATPAGGFRR